MIDYLSDSCTGRITEFPHIMQGCLTGSYSNGNGADFSGRGCGNTGDEVLKCDGKYIYIRDRYNSNDVNVFDEDGYKVKTISINDIDF